MRRSIGWWCALALVIAACSGSADTTTTATESLVTTSSPSATTLVAGESASTTKAELGTDYLFELVETEALGTGVEPWENGFVSPGAVVLHDGEWHMFYNAGPNRNSAGVSGVGHALSLNGLDFFRQEPEPLFEASAPPYVDEGAGSVIPGSVLVEPGGTWVMYFSTTGFEGRFGSGVIGRATARAPEGPWEFDPEPLLSPGDAGEWDQLSTVNPHVLAVGERYLMWYDAHQGDLDAKPTRQIGFATSDNGLAWTKHDDPSTAEPPFHVSDPVLRLGAGDAWDSFRVMEPSVIEVADGFVMFYGADRRYEGQLERTWEWGYATSADGIAWERDAPNPIWSSIGDMFTLMFNSTSVRTPDGVWRIYVGTQNGISLPTSVRVLEYGGDLP